MSSHNFIYGMCYYNFISGISSCNFIYGMSYNYYIYGMSNLILLMKYLIYNFIYEMSNNNICGLSMSKCPKYQIVMFSLAARMSTGNCYFFPVFDLICFYIFVKS